MSVQEIKTKTKTSHVIGCVCNKCLHPNAKVGRKPGKYGKYIMKPKPKRISVHSLHIKMRKYTTNQEILEEFDEAINNIISQNEIIKFGRG